MDTLDVGEAKSDGKGIKYRWQISEEELLKPDQINILTVTLPNGLSARFLRTNDWTKAVAK
jgi:hypothetical protein